MGRIVIIVLMLIFVNLGTSDLRAQDQIRDLVVKIHAVHHTPDVLRPWSRNTPQQIKGLGRGHRRATAFSPTLMWFGMQARSTCSPINRRNIYRHGLMRLPRLWIWRFLKLDDETFFDKRGSLPFAKELPRVKDNINVYGYPTGGTELSVTQGIVSRIEYTDYYYQAAGLRIQVDAALNFGNSGGPAVSDGKLVGLVFSLIQNAQNIGYLIPVEEIQLFLDDVNDGVYDGKPQTHDLIQTVENERCGRDSACLKGLTGSW